MHDKKTLRAEVIARRNAAGPDDGAGLLRQFERSVLPLLDHQKYTNISAYWPMDGEADVRPVMRLLERRGFRIGLPEVMAKGKPLVFRPWHTGMEMEARIWGIPVPKSDEHLIPHAMLVPLVAFDARGYRLGYGGGFYDRSIEHLTKHHHKPLLIGVARACQQVEAVPHERWDERLDLVVTEEGCMRFGLPSQEHAVEQGA